ncbi:YdcF family protein [Candidatus Kaiserbacteria bacterium]|nr:YdcF family protein [Candidatus Kaiserbacteria bacterium]
MKETKKEFGALLDTQQLEKGDVIYVLQGDGIFRAAHAAKLHKDGFAPLVAIVGSGNDRAYGSFPSPEVKEEMVRLGVPKEKVLLEEVGPHTRGEADRGMELAKKYGWRTILIVTSPHHEYRAFLTFLKAMRDARLDLRLVRATAPLSWSEETPWGKRIDLLGQEFDRIVEYQKKGDVASYEEGIAYLESQ